MALVAAAAFAPAATAEDPPPVRPALPYAAETANVVVHYTSDSADAGAITRTQANDLAALTEAVLARITSWGFPRPLADADGKVDVYVVPLSAPFAAVAIPDGGAPVTTGSIDIDPAWITDTTTLAHELFHLVQFGIWMPSDPWILEATAEWAGANASDFAEGAPEKVPFEMSLDCSDRFDALGHIHCSKSLYENGGYSRWPFFQFIAERHGRAIVNDILVRGAAAGAETPPIFAVAGALAARGASLADTFGDWTTATMSGGYQAAALKALAPEPYAGIATGTTTGSLATISVPVDHLAARYVAFRRGDGSGVPVGICHPATLSVTVTLPAATGARPHFYWPPTGAAVPLAVSGNTASVALPWDTCNWSQSAMLSLPNPSLSLDAQVFRVAATVTVDKTRIATAAPPPTPWYTGPTVAAPTADEPPAIALYGPETLRLSRKATVLRLVVFSSGRGALLAEIGGTRLGLRDLRPGSNDLRFTVARTLARSLSSRGRLTVTSLSPDGERGESVTRKLVLTK